MSEKQKHLKKIHEKMEGTPICQVIHKLGLCGCQEHEKENENE